jgi:hypothetical protein
LCTNIGGGIGGSGSCIGGSGSCIGGSGSCIGGSIGGCIGGSGGGIGGSGGGISGSDGGIGNCESPELPPSILKLLLLHIITIVIKIAIMINKINSKIIIFL